MKLTVPLLLLTFASVKAGAFQAKVDATKLALKPDVSRQGVASALNIAVIHPRLWAGIPVAGCQCPFCTQMRLLAG